LGANIGYITLLMCELVGPSGLVYAIEPDPNNFRLLKANIALNNYMNIVEMHQEAIIDSVGQTKFFVGKNASNLGSVNQHSKTVKDFIKVKANTLVKFLEKKKTPNLIKMDIEGAEVLVLKGLYEKVQNEKFPCKIVMEIHPQFYNADNGLDLWLDKYFLSGFKPKYVVSAGVIIPDLFKKWGYKPTREFKSCRGLFESMSTNHVIDACCYEHKQWMPQKKKYSMKVVRFLMIERK
jgi:FkbM family methyltransferase